MQELKKRSSLVLIISLVIEKGLLFAMPDNILAQPALPNALEQSTIEVGPGILASIAGAYALKNCLRRIDFLILPTFYIFSESYSDSIC